jgi:TolA-binding protein
LGIALASVTANRAPAADDAQERAALRDYNAAAALQNSGLYDRAAEKWMAFVRQYTSDAHLDRAYYYLGICHLHGKKYAEATQAFQTLLGKYPAFANAESAQYNLGIARYQAAVESKKAEDFKAAAAELAALAGKYPQGQHMAAALYYQGEALLSAADAQGAMEAYKKLLGSFPASTWAPEACYALGTAQQEAGQDSEAIASFQKFLASPTAAGGDLATEVRLRLGLSLVKQKKFVEAEPLLAAAAATANFASADLALLRQGQCRLQMGNPAGAAEVLADLPRRFPNSPYKSEAELAAGRCCFTSGKLAEAQKLLEPLAKAQGREAAEAVYWLAQTLLKLSKPQEALAAAESGLKLGPPGDAAAHLELIRADALYDLPGRRKEALPLYEKFAAQHADHPLTAQALYMAASAAFSDKDYAAARRDAESFLGNARLANHELTPAMLCLAAESCLAPTGGDGAKAEFWYRQVADRFAKTSYAAQAQYKLGEMAARQKKHEEALACFKQCLAASPPAELAARARYGLAATCFAKEDDKGASSALDELLAAKPDTALAARARYLRGLVLQRQKQLEAAAKELEGFLSGQPSADEAADARYTLVLCRIAMKQFDEAGAGLAKLVAQKPDYAAADRAYYELGHALLEENRADDAVKAFGTLAEKYPGSPLAAEGWFHVGRRYEAAAERATADDQKAAAVARAADAYSAGLAKAKDADLREKLQYKLADMQFRRKQFSQAAATLQSQLGEHPSGSLAGAARFLTAECLFGQNKFDEALPLFTQAAADSTAKYRAQALYRAGVSAANQKKWPESQKFYETLLRDFPKFEQLHEARYGMAVALQNLGRAAEARAAYEQIVKATESETAAKARFMLGELAFADRKFEDAIEQYVFVTAGYPYKHWQALAQFEIARCFLSLGRQQKAVDAFQTVVTKYPDDTKAQDAARMLEGLK